VKEMKVLIVHHHRFELWHAPPWLRDRLRSAFPDFQFLQLETYDRVPQEIADTDVFIGWSLRPEQFVAAKKLRWIHSPAAAVHQLMYPELIASDVVVTNSSNVHGPVVAEHAIAVLLALAKRFPQAMEYQREKKWAQTLLWNERPRPRELSGANVVVVGVGGIGSAFIRHAKHFGMHVIAVREDVKKGRGEADEVVSVTELEQVLPRADYVLLSTPVTPATTGMINESRLNKMKPDAYLINVGRGPLVDEAALCNALQTGRIAGAALDVFVDEPLPADSPLWSLKNLLITPHTAAVTERLWDRHYELIVENLVRLMAGNPLLNRVDTRRGY
jgi:phosphoglycerate dehydrogenase-like enzyme